jgi:hypothetical protein
MRQEFDLGIFIVDPADPEFKAKLKKLIDSLQKDDLTYMPFLRKR